MCSSDLAQPAIHVDLTWNFVALCFCFFLFLWRGGGKHGWGEPLRFDFEPVMCPNVQSGACLEAKMADMAGLLVTAICHLCPRPACMRCVA